MRKCAYVDLVKRNNKPETTKMNNITDAKLRILTVADAINAGKTSKADIKELQAYLDDAKVSIMSDDADEAETAMQIAEFYTTLGKLNINR